MLEDFSGYIGFKGTQELDNHGKFILDQMNVYNLIMLNDAVECKG